MRKLCLLLLLVVFACRSSAEDVISKPFVGVTHIHRTLSNPRPLNINIVIIDLQAEGIGFVVTPDNGAASGDADPASVTSFLASTGAQIGINAGYYNMKTNDVLGFVTARGYNYSCFEDYNQWEYWPTPYVALNLSIWNMPSMVFPNGSLPTCASTPVSQTWNAVPGSEWIVQDGAVAVDNLFAVNPYLNPRTLAGFTADNQELILVTIDGRQAGFSEGMTMTEAADFLVSIGAYQGIAFDGGGSTTMAFADPVPRVVNSPSGGFQRSVPNHLGVLAQIAGSIEDRIIYSDFENGDEGTFTQTPGYSGSTQGILSAQSTADPCQNQSWLGQWCQKLFIKDDPEATRVSENPTGGWFVRWVSGSQAHPSENIPRQTSGYVGFWLKTQADDLSVSLCVDNDGHMERGIPTAVINDGYWHCYQWSLENNSKWQSWINGDGDITGGSFTLDSIQIFGPDADAEIFIDAISHDLYDPIDNIDDCLHVWKAGQGMPADLDENCHVDCEDLMLLVNNWLEINSEYDISNDDQENIINFSDMAVMAKSWLRSNIPADAE